ncbi:MAG: TatD family hydrolase [Candidatus Diapherotrites archaeon]
MNKLKKNFFFNPSMFFDAHCHLNEFQAPEKEIIECRKAKVALIASNSVDLDSMQKNLLLVEKFPEVKCALGLHPSNLLRMNEKEAIESVKFIEKNIELASAVGEIGLDYKHADCPKKKERQKKFFEQQLEIAERNGKPVIVHSRMAAKDCIALLQNHECKALMHWFSGSKEELEEAVRLGAFFSIGPAVEFSQEIRAIARIIPAERLLSETDAPVSFQGKSSAPHWIPRVVKAIAAARGEEKRQIVLQIEKNFKNFF